MKQPLSSTKEYAKLNKRLARKEWAREHQGALLAIGLVVFFTLCFMAGVVVANNSFPPVLAVPGARNVQK